jgi:hypothetical protein
LYRKRGRVLFFEEKWKVKTSGNSRQTERKRNSSFIEAKKKAKEKLQRSELIIHDDTGYALTGANERKSNFFSLAAFFIIAATKPKSNRKKYFINLFSSLFA